jgi:hypothetical protein
MLENGNLLVTIPMDLKDRGNGKTIAFDGEDADEAGRTAFLLAVARGRAWQRLVDDGRVRKVHDCCGTSHGRGKPSRSSGRSRNWSSEPNSGEEHPAAFFKRSKTTVFWPKRCSERPVRPYCRFQDFAIFWSKCSCSILKNLATW